MAPYNSALIGHTGFVGTTLQRTRMFTELFNSRNIADVRGRRYDRLICAGAPASMWAANQDPAADSANLTALGDLLATTEVEHFILISTIAVLDDASAGYDEDHATYESSKAYGRNRRAFEERLQAHFPNIHILRLPALFGHGLKKNFIFDILNPVPSFLRPDRFEALQDKLSPSLAGALADFYLLDPGLNMMALDRATLNGSDAKAELTQAIVAAEMEAARFTNSASHFQYYDLSRLADDIDTVIAADLQVVNVCSEPISAGDIYRELTGAPFTNDAPVIVQEDMRSIHAELFGGAGPYLFDRADTLARLQVFYETETGR